MSKPDDRTRTKALDYGTKNEPLTDEVMERVEGMYARELDKAAAGASEDGPVEIETDDQGVGLAKYSDDRGTPELREREQAYETETVEGKQRRKVRRTSDLMRLMLNSRLITRPEAEAGRKFRADFDVAKLDPRRAPDLGRIPGLGGRHQESDRQMDAARRVSDAMLALGGFGTINAQCAWWVLGGGMSATEWGQKKIFGGGRAISKHHASGIVMATVGLLARHYGLEK